MALKCPGPLTHLSQHAHLPHSCPDDEYSAIVTKRCCSGLSAATIAGHAGSNGGATSEVATACAIGCSDRRRFASSCSSQDQPAASLPKVLILTSSAPRSRSSRASILAKSSLSTSHSPSSSSSTSAQRRDLPPAPASSLGQKISERAPIPAVHVAEHPVTAGIGGG